MTFHPKSSVTDGLDNLASRLEPIISERFPLDLEGLPWTVVLAELDRNLGRTPSEYRTTDLQAQLNMLTRRLGEFGYPYDDRQRTVSTLGQELRIMRNAWAHGEVLTTLDAWRTHDYCVRLLEYFGDSEGVQEASRLRDDAFRAYVAETSVQPQPVNSSLADEDAPVDAVVADDIAAEDDEVEPDREVFESDDEQCMGNRLLDARREEWEPWESVAVGEPEDLDHMRRVGVREKVRAVVQEIVAAEGPVHLDRVVLLTGRAFRLRRVGKRRRRSIENQAKKNCGLHFDNDEFLWPQDVDPKTWSEFRPNSSKADRPFQQISPVEVANAIRFLRRRHPEYDQDELRRATLRTFGRVRMTAGIRAQLAAAERRSR